MPNRTSKAFSAWQTCIQRDKEFRQKIGIEQDMEESQRMCKKLGNHLLKLLEDVVDFSIQGFEH